MSYKEVTVVFETFYTIIVSIPCLICHDIFVSCHGISALSKIENIIWNYGTLETTKIIDTYSLLLDDYLWMKKTSFQLAYTIQNHLISMVIYFVKSSIASLMSLNNIVAECLALNVAGFGTFNYCWLILTEHWPWGCS